EQRDGHLRPAVVDAEPVVSAATLAAGRGRAVRSERYRIDLSRQMAGCDANYIRLLKLLQQLEGYRHGVLQYAIDAGYSREFVIDSAADRFKEAAAMESRVRLRVLEVFPYTSTLEITQLNRLSQWVEPPSVLIRVYHDAHAAEAVASQGHRGFLARYDIPNSRMYHQDEKRQINEFLGEWLNLCVQAGRSMAAPIFCSA